MGLLKKIGIGLLVLIVLGMIFGGNSDNPSAATSTDNAKTSTQATPPSATQPTTPTELTLNVGEIAKTSKIEVNVLSAQNIKSYDYYSDILKETITKDASPGKTFVLVDAEIKNVGSDSTFVGSSEFSITDSEGYKYDPTLYYGQSNDGLETIKQLYQNQKMKGKILFEIPENAQNLKLQYDFGNLFIGTKLASWTLQ